MSYSMKEAFLLVVLLIFFCDTNLMAENLNFSNDPENNSYTFKSLLNYKGDNSINNIDTSAVNIDNGTIPDKKENRALKGKIYRWDRVYRRNMSADKNEFKGHLPLFEIGINSFAKTDYSGYSVPNFMDLNNNKSCEVNIRLLRYSAGLQKIKNNIGLITGLELNLNDYRFSNPYTLITEGGHTEPLLLDENGLSKTKLSTTFLTVPLSLEFQFPARRNNSFFISAGVIGGLKIGSHTKVIHFSDKTKNHNDFNINPFRYGATFRIGYRDINLFATYYKTPFFKNERGPEIFPFTIGIGLINK